jgi:uncharacterized protein (TIGR03089 family)
MPNSHSPQNSHGNPSTGAPRDVGGLLRLITREPGRPRLTWYGDDGERVELSGAVLENWVNKVTNLLVEEFDAGPGTRIAIDLPTHWRTIIWALATWRIGATTIFTWTDGADGADLVKGPVKGKADVVITTRPGVWEGTGPEIVAVALPALARRFDGELPSGSVDAASAVMTYGDKVGWAPQVDEMAVAVETARPVLHRDLLRGISPADSGRRALVTTADRDTDLVLREVLGVWSAAGSVVLATTTDPDRLERIGDTERASPWRS